MRNRALIVCVVGLLLAGGCRPETRPKGVYVLFDGSDAVTGELADTPAIVQQLLLALKPRDTLAVATIDTEHFSKNDILAGITFAPQPILANHQKRVFLDKVRRHFQEADQHKQSDLSGGILHAIEFLNQTPSREKYIVLISDLQEPRSGGDIFQLNGFHIVAPDANALSVDERDTERNQKRVRRWRQKVEASQGTWHIIRNSDMLAGLLTASAASH
ncbi:MAG TPA: hypothetical protein ACFCUC_10865 [Desulfobacterales bacterium]